jgi:hypothetical protein
MNANDDHPPAGAEKPRTVEYATPAPIDFPGTPLFTIMARLTITLVVIGLCMYMFISSLGRAGPTANLVNCSSRLRQIGQAYQLYLDDFRAPPPDLVALAETQDISLAEFRCLLTDTDIPDRSLTLPQQAAIAQAKPLAHISYEYIYRPVAAGPDEIIAYDRLENYAGYLRIPSDINVLFGDGRVETWKVADVKQKLQATPR